MKKISLLLAAALCLSCQSLSAQDLSPVSIEDGVANVSQANSAIQFVGIHVGDEPKPRLGGFEEFTGKIGINDDGNAIANLNLEIKIGSVWTQFDKLTGHLLTADFFEAEEFGKASFESTELSENNVGEPVIVGNLTLLGNTRKIQIPYEATVDSSGVVLKSEFQLNRKLFGMDKMTSGVEKIVSVKFVVGHKTVVVPEGDSNPLETQKETDEEKPMPDATVTVSLHLPNMT